MASPWAVRGESTRWVQHTRWQVEIMASELAGDVPHIPRAQRLLLHGSVDQMVETIAMLKTVAYLLSDPEKLVSFLDGLPGGWDQAMDEEED